MYIELASTVLLTISLSFTIASISLIFFGVLPLFQKLSFPSKQMSMGVTLGVSVDVGSYSVAHENGMFVLRNRIRHIIVRRTEHCSSINCVIKLGSWRKYLLVFSIVISLDDYVGRHKSVITRERFMIYFLIEA